MSDIDPAVLASPWMPGHGRGVVLRSGNFNHGLKGRLKHILGKLKQEESTITKKAGNPNCTVGFFKRSYSKVSTLYGQIGTHDFSAVNGNRCRLYNIYNI